MSDTGQEPYTPSDDQLRDIARRNTGTGYYSGGVKALRAVWEEARAAHDAEVARAAAEKAWDEGHAHCFHVENPATGRVNPYRLEQNDE